jgi:hypothetical protein
MLGLLFQFLSSVEAMNDPMQLFFFFLSKDDGLCVSVVAYGVQELYAKLTTVVYIDCCSKHAWFLFLSSYYRVNEN